MSAGQGALPALELRTLQGDSIALIDPTVPARLIVVYAHDCDVCRLVLPVIERVSRAFHGRRLLTLGVSQSDEDGTLDTINEHGLCFPQALDPELDVSHSLGVATLPTVLLADGEGRVVVRSEGLDRATLREVLIAAARRSEADVAAVERAIDAFALPDDRPGSPAR